MERARGKHYNSQAVSLNFCLAVNAFIKRTIQQAVEMGIQNISQNQNSDSKLIRVASLRTWGKWQWQVTSLTLGGSANVYTCIVLLFSNINQHTVCELLCQVESAVSKQFAGFHSKWQPWILFDKLAKKKKKIK